MEISMEQLIEHLLSELGDAGQILSHQVFAPRGAKYAECSLGLLNNTVLPLRTLPPGPGAGFRSPTGPAILPMGRGFIKGDYWEGYRGLTDAKSLHDDWIAYYDPPNNGKEIECEDE